MLASERRVVRYHAAPPHRCVQDQSELITQQPSSAHRFLGRNTLSTSQSLPPLPCWSAYTFCAAPVKASRLYHSSLTGLSHSVATSPPRRPSCSLRPERRGGTCFLAAKHADHTVAYADAALADEGINALDERVVIVGVGFAAEVADDGHGFFPTRWAKPGLGCSPCRCTAARYVTAHSNSSRTAALGVPCARSHSRRSMATSASSTVDYDGGEQLNALISFKPRKAGTYRIIATT